MQLFCQRIETFTSENVSKAFPPWFQALYEAIFNWGKDEVESGSMVITMITYEERGSLIMSN
jgi:hypothetical protein